MSNQEALLRETSNRDGITQITTTLPVFRPEQVTAPEWMKHVSWILAEAKKNSHPNAMGIDMYMRVNERCVVNPYIGTSAYFDTRGENILQADSAYSAFFSVGTERFEGKIKDVLKIEAAISNLGKRRVHDFLRDRIDYYQREAQGFIVRSGHTTVVSVNGQTHEMALIDKVVSDLPIEEEELTIAASLIAHDILPISADGAPLIH